MLTVQSVINQIKRRLLYYTILGSDVEKVISNPFPIVRRAVSTKDKSSCPVITMPVLFNMTLLVLFSALTVSVIKLRMQYVNSKQTRVKVILS